MLPHLDGVELRRELRARADVPIIMVTARGEEADWVLGLEAGADDDVPKPFSSRELLARIRAQARRSRGRAGPSNRPITVGPLTVDPGWHAGHARQRGARPHHLRVQPAQGPGGAGRARAEPRAAAGPRARQRRRGVRPEHRRPRLDLRAKLGDDARSPRWLLTVRGVGYMLAADRPA